MSTKFFLVCEGGHPRPRITHAIFYGTREAATTESIKIAKVLALAGYHSFRLFKDNDSITEFEVFTETTVTARNIEVKT